jgi:hypothetical protein
MDNGDDALGTADTESRQEIVRAHEILADLQAHHAFLELFPSNPLN